MLLIPPLGKEIDQLNDVPGDDRLQIDAHIQPGDIIVAEPFRTDCKLIGSPVLNTLSGQRSDYECST